MKFRNLKPQPVGQCIECERNIYAGNDKVVMVDGDMLCEDCLDRMPPKKLIQFLGFELKEVKG